MVPPRVLPSQGIDWGSLFQSLCLGKVENSANKDTVRSDNKIKVSQAKLKSFLYLIFIFKHFKIEVQLIYNDVLASGI